MKFWQILANLRRTSQLSWLELAVLVAFFCGLSFGQLGRFSWPVTWYPHDVVIALWLGLTIKGWWPKLWQQWQRVNWRRWWSARFFAGWLVLGVAISFGFSHDWQLPLYFGRLVIYSVFLFSLWSKFALKPVVLRILLVSTGLYMVWFGLVQYWLIPDARYLYILGWDDHYFRLIGPLLDPNLSGILFVITSWLVVSFRKLIPKPLVVSLLSVCLLAVVSTYSRATYLAAILSIAIYWIVSVARPRLLKHTITSFIIFILALLVLSLAPKPGGEGVDLLRTASINARIESSIAYLNYLKGYQWLTGAGLYSILPGQSADTHARMPDNFFVLLIWSTGLVGLALFFTFFTRLITVIKQWQPETIALFSAVMIHSQFNNTLLEPFVFLILGIALISDKRS